MAQMFELSAVLDIPELPAYLKSVDECMSDTLKAEQSHLSDAILRLTQARGKRLRPALLIASALLSKKVVNDSVIMAAAAIELIHIGSLVHDDIIDEAESRWGISTINSNEGTDFAILAGDYLFSKACQLSAKANQTSGILAAETIAKLSEGQAAEISFCYNISRTKADFERAIYGKTAALFATACQMGGICSGQSENQQTALSNFGRDFGMSFQLVDDVLDFVSSSAMLGKPTGNDVKEGVYTLPIILSLNGSKGDIVKSELDKKTAASEQLIKMLLNDGSINEVIAQAEKYNKNARSALNIYDDSSTSLGLLPSRYLQWALEKLVAPKYKSKIHVPS